MTSNSLIEKAKITAQKIHENRERISGCSFYEHVCKVADLLNGLGVSDENILCAAYLHHALDSPKNVDIEKEFNKEIFEIVSEYKRISNDRFSEISPGDQSPDLIIQTYFNLVKNSKVLLIRLADKTDNIKTAHLLPKDTSNKVAERALYIYAPLCRAIGLSKFVRVLEDGAFKILNPKEYYKVEHYIKCNFPRIHRQLEDVKNFLIEVLKENDLETKIYTRTKGIYSTYTKRNRYLESGQIHDPNEFRGIMDYAGLRIIVDSEEDCYRVEGVINKYLEPISNTRNDYILQPKPNGYKSLQCSYHISNKFVVEIQIRTFAMHEVNEMGQASHVAYKFGPDFAKSIRENPNILKEISYSLKKTEFTIDHFSKSIYVYTPKGDIKKLPLGATVLDFAYSIHRDLGNSAIGGEVNMDFKSLDYKIQNGDTVNIKTSNQKKHPGPGYAKTVVTKKARGLIRKALRDKEKLIF